MESSTIISEARARIIWGESASSVREFLILNGISADAADRTIREICLERRKEIKNIGRRNLLIGSLLAGTGGITTYLILALDIHLPPGFNGLLAMPMVAGAYGLWKLGIGIVYLAFPKSEHRSIPDIIESDL